MRNSFAVTDYLPRPRFSTKGEFESALTCAQKSDRVFVIELKIQRSEVSSQLEQIANEVRKIRGTNNSPIKS